MRGPFIHVFFSSFSLKIYSFFCMALIVSPEIIHINLATLLGKYLIELLSHITLRKRPSKRGNHFEIRRNANTLLGVESMDTFPVPLAWPHFYTHTYTFFLPYINHVGFEAPRHFIYKKFSNLYILTCYSWTEHAFHLC